MLNHTIQRGIDRPTLFDLLIAYRLSGSFELDDFKRMGRDKGKLTGATWGMPASARSLNQPCSSLG
jgi:hypothetical protein